MKTTIALLALTALLSTGCQTSTGRWYADQDWTPDSLGYEAYLSARNGKPETHGIGLTWNLKPEGKK